MNVLDIDLDFFLDQSVGYRTDDPNDRPDEYGLVPWTEGQVTGFLENTLNLKPTVPGKIVESHHEVFYQWKKLIEAGDLLTPFRVIHVDAHSDLGLASLSWSYLHSEFLSMSIKDRPNARQGDDGINFTNFLAFAIGCRWIAEIDFVVNHNWNDDIPRELLSDESHELVKTQAPLSVLPYRDYELEIELMRTPEWDPETSNWNIFEERKPVGEPRVPFNIITVESVGTTYSDAKWDYVFLSHSPGYVPSDADHLLDHIGVYIGEL